MSYNQKLRAARVARGFTMWDVALLVGVRDNVTYSKWEYGKHKPKRIHCEKLCTLFGMSMSELGLELPKLGGAHPGSKRKRDAAEL